MLSEEVNFFLMKVNMTLVLMKHVLNYFTGKRKKKHLKYKYYHKARLGDINIYDIFHMFS